MTPLLSSTLLATQCDARLSALAAEGHDRAFEAIVERYRKPLGRYLRRLLSDTLAEDVLQATFVRAWQAIRTGAEVRDLRPWLYRIAHNQAVNALRAAGERTLPEAEPAPGPEVAVAQRDELRRTLDDIGELPDRQRAALVAVAVADRPHADVARELGMSDGALRQLLLRARMALRAAATAVTPTPLATWLAAGQDATAGRVAEVALGAGGVGVAVKASAAVVASAVVVGAPVALKDRHDSPPRAKQAPAATAPATKTSTVDDRGASSGTGGRGESEPGDDHGGASGRGGDDNSGHGSGSDGHGSGSSGHGSGSSGHGSGSSGSSGGSGSSSGSSGSGSSGSGSSGSGSSGGSGKVDDD